MADFGLTNYSLTDEPDIFVNDVNIQISMSEISAFFFLRFTSWRYQCGILYSAKQMLDEQTSDNNLEGSSHGLIETLYRRFPETEDNHKTLESV